MSKTMNFIKPLIPSPRIITLPFLIDVNNHLALCLACRCHLIFPAPGIQFISHPPLLEMQTFFSREGPCHRFLFPV